MQATKRIDFKDLESNDQKKSSPSSTLSIFSNPNFQQSSYQSDDDTSRQNFFMKSKSLFKNDHMKQQVEKKISNLVHNNGSFDNESSSFSSDPFSSNMQVFVPAKMKIDL